MDTDHKILSHLFKEGELSFRSLQKATKISPRILRKYLNRLINAGLINERNRQNWKRGKRLWYSLTKKGENTYVHQVLDNMDSSFRGLQDIMKKLPIGLTGPLDGYLHPLALNDLTLNEMLTSSLPEWIYKIDLTAPPQPTHKTSPTQLPSFLFLSGEEWKGKTLAELDEQFFLQGLPRLLEILFQKTMEITANINQAEQDNPLDWLQKALNFNIFVAFKLNGKQLYSKIKEDPNLTAKITELAGKLKSNTTET